MNNDEILLLLKSNSLSNQSDHSVLQSLTVKDIELFSSSSPSNYKIFRIPKKDPGDYRQIEEPVLKLKVIQKSIIKFLEVFPFESCVYGIKGTSAIDHALQHEGKTVIIKVDIFKFFPSTCDWHIVQKGLLNFVTTLDLKELQNFREQVVTFLPFCLFKDSSKQRLPTGAPSSPILANIAFSTADIFLKDLAEKNSLTYTRYMDDLIFSGDKHPKREFRTKLQQIIKDNNYRINYKKGYQVLYKETSKQLVTGVRLNNNEARVNKEYKNNLRSAINHYIKEGNREFSSELTGKLNYVRQLNPKLYEKFIEYFQRRIEKYNVGS